MLTTCTSVAVRWPGGCHGRVGLASFLPAPQFLKACDDHGTVGAPEGSKRSPSKVYRASAFLQLGGSEERAEAAGL